VEAVNTNNMKNLNMHAIRIAAALATSLLAAPAAQATDAHVGVGIFGPIVGASTAVGNGITLRGDFSGGLSTTRDGREGNVDYTGKIKASRVGGYLDWHPFTGVFRVSAGVSFNDVKLNLNGRGGNSTINGKPVDLTKETFNLNVKYPSTTPYLGMGWGHGQGTDAGFGFFADFGVLFGSFKATATTTAVGKNGITQADVDAEVADAMSSVNKVKVLPVVQLGLTYRF
jgi:hypothetical protein